VRDAIIDAFSEKKRELTVAEIREYVSTALDEYVAPSSIRSYLRINTPGRFQRVARGKYKMVVAR
jgi:site-specific DNA-methyltransferase (adenine-specific)